MLNLAIAFSLLVSMAASALLQSIEWFSVARFLGLLVYMFAMLRFTPLGSAFRPSLLVHRLFYLAYICIPIYGLVYAGLSRLGANGIATALAASLFLLPMPILLVAGRLSCSISRLVDNRDREAELKTL
jgi:predicted neutral ceramidase superfamily lipid hydrolase